MPSFMTRKDYMVIEERNKQRRMKVVETVIKNLEVYGRGSYNGFGTGFKHCAKNIIDEVGKVFVADNDVILRKILCGFLAGGHILF